ncbi:thioredoxin family protein [Patescibacteria group bacterium]
MHSDQRYNTHMKVLKIGAVWCADCIVMKPRWKKIEDKNSWLETEYYEYDDSEEIIKKYDLENDEIPVFIFLDKKGEEIERLVGEFSEKELLDKIGEHKNK